MRNLKVAIIVLSLLIWSATSAPAEVSVGIGIGTPNLSIGINLGGFPELAPVPGYPVYYAPQVAGNYFFYDGLYWVFADDRWYAGEWYDGPWWLVQPEYVPVYILRIPVRYYRHPPPYFRGWRTDAPPRWGVHWGPEWEKHRRGWDRWDRRHIPKRAPLPFYQRQFREDRYPRMFEEQQNLRRQHYRYEPRDRKVRQLQPPQRPVPGRSERAQQPRVMGPERHVAPDVRRPGPPQQPPRERHERDVRQPMEQPRGGQLERREPRPQQREQRFENRERHGEPEGRGREGRKEEERGRGR